MKNLVFFNNKGGVGKTSLVYHLSWMFADMGLNVLAADFDPQSNLTSMFLEEDRLEELWPDGQHPETILGVVDPLRRGTGDLANPHLEQVGDSIALLCGDLGLSLFEDKLSAAWPLCSDGDEAAFRFTSAFYRTILAASEKFWADLVLIDVGPNLGAINRAAVLTAEHVIIPLAPDLFSLQGLKNLGPTLRFWRSGWEERLRKRPKDLPLPPASGMQPSGYVVMQHSARLDRPAKAYQRWAERIPGVYREAVLDEAAGFTPVKAEEDPYRLSLVKHYRSLMPMAMEVRKPVFHLKPADGAIGSHQDGVRACERDFRELASAIARSCHIPLP